MSFQDFDLEQIRKQFGIAVTTNQPLFRNIEGVAISQGLRAYWDNLQALGLSLITEKARSEFLVAPLLGEVWLRSKRQVSLLSGVMLNVDESAGLKGICDFLLCRSPMLYLVQAPILVAVEAKRDNIPEGFGQCAAEMIAAQRWNVQQKESIPIISGCVTTGAAWRFLQLEGSTLQIDLDEYSISQAEQVLGILLHCCGVTGL
jgi:hypothetical protein